MIEITEKDGAIRVRVRVQPRASETALAGEHAGALKVKIAAAPDKGRANRALLEFLSERLGVRPSAISIVLGEHSRDKLLFIRGIGKEELSERLGIG